MAALRPPVVLVVIPMATLVRVCLTSIKLASWFYILLLMVLVMAMIVTPDFIRVMFFLVVNIFQVHLVQALLSVGIIKLTLYTILLLQSLVFIILVQILTLILLDRFLTLMVKIGLIMDIMLLVLF